VKFDLLQDERGGPKYVADVELIRAAMAFSEQIRSGAVKTQVPDDGEETAGKGF
jgi:hypothetical protein